MNKAKKKEDLLRMTYEQKENIVVIDVGSEITIKWPYAEFIEKVTDLMDERDLLYHLSELDDQKHLFSSHAYVREKE